VRVDVPVGVAYGSDTEAVMRELLDVAEATEHVMPEPKPRVLFLGFGDSTLNFELRVFSPTSTAPLSIRHDLHSRSTARSARPASRSHSRSATCTSQRRARSRPGRREESGQAGRASHREIGARQLRT
jgi:hypothetical protein